MIKLVSSLICLSLVIQIYLSLKIFENLGKYKDLEIEAIKMWHLKITTLLVVIGALGMMPKTAASYISQIPGAPSLTELQKITLVGSTHILRKVLLM